MRDNWTPLDTFEEALEFTLSHEGGWYPGDKSYDPNPTMKGVTQKTYDAWRKSRGFSPGTSVRFMLQSEMEDIYHNNYWRGLPAQLAALNAPEAAITTFDHAVNAGPKAAVKVVQRALNTLVGPSQQIVVDGIWGPKSQALAERCAANRHLLAFAIHAQRQREYVRIAKPQLKRPALYSWMHRMASFTDKYLCVEA